jgi:hypothetical protein
MLVKKGCHFALHQLVVIQFLKDSKSFIVEALPMRSGAQPTGMIKQPW